MKKTFEEISEKSDFSFEKNGSRSGSYSLFGKKRTSDIPFGYCASVETRIDISTLEEA
jgi:hypothetical protein